MESDPTPETEEHTTLGKRKRSVDDQNLECLTDQDNASHKDISEDDPFHNEGTSPTTKRSRVAGYEEAMHLAARNANSGSGASMLSPEILQHIFLFVDPVSLGRLMSVCRQFHMLLDPTKTLPVSSNSGRLRLHDQNDVWSISRRAHSSAFPRPMDDTTELDMWRLLRGISCQFCGKHRQGKAPLLANSPWSSGPGPAGVRSIWPFRIKTCGNCLESRLVKDTELLLSSSSVLIPGLPFAVFTPSLNYVATTTLRQNQPPANLSLTKYYFRPQIQALEASMATARSLGQAAVEEWYKGLEQSGKSQISDAAKFEQWEAGVASHVHIDSGAAHRLSASTSTTTSPAATSPTYSMNSSAMCSNQLSLNSPRPLSTISTPQYVVSQAASVFGSTTPAHVPFQSLSMVAGYQSPEYRPFAGSFSPMSVAMQVGSFNPNRPRQERNFQEIIRMKAERRAEIERRCLNLDPLIRASTLTYMDAFNAAVQIPMPLNDNAWDVLKARLLAQRADAEQRELQQTTATTVTKAEGEDRGPKEEHQPPATPGSEDIWDQIEKPTRDKIKDYAKEYITSIWADGKAINKATSGKFAADVLQHVRRRFYEAVAEEDKTLAAQQITISEDSPLHDTRKLKLDDMKWIFEEAIRPHTERFGREIFLCSMCDAGAKRFSFDAVIQHYAAKHTSELSRGNAIVYWKADWPADPPFHPSPDTVWHREPDHRMGFTPHYAGSQYAASPPYFPNPGPSWMSPMYVPPSQPNGLYNVQCDELVSATLQIWEATDEIRNLSHSVRLYVIIHHVAMRLAQRFTNEPPLSMFADCITHKPALRALKDLHGLQCKSCRAFGDGFGRTPFQQDLPTYRVAELFDHFQRTHLDIDARTPQHNFGRPATMSGMDAPRMDWKFDMIELPHESAIRSLMYSPGINLQKLQTISSVLPHYFPVPLPPIEPIPFEAGHHSRSSSKLGPLLHDARHDDKLVQGTGPVVRGPALRHGPRRFDISHEGYGRPLIGHEQRHIVEPQHEPQGYTELLPSRDIVYIQRPTDDIGRVEHLASSNRPGHHERDDRGIGELYVVQRGRPHQQIAGSRRHTPSRSRYSPVVEDSPHLPAQAPVDTYDEPMHEDPDSPQPLDEESHPPSPQQRDVLSATENFLNNFDIIGTNTSTGNTPRHSVHDATSPRRISSLSRPRDRGRMSHIGTPSRVRQIEDSALSRSSATRRQSPPAASQHRSRNVSPDPSVDSTGGMPLRSSMRPTFHMTEQLDQHTLTSDQTTLLQRREQADWSRYEERYSLRTSPDEGHEPTGAPYESYSTALGSQDDRYRYSREPPSPGMQHRQYHELPKRYIEILPDGQQRIIEEYPAPKYAPVEFIRRAPMDDRYDDSRGGYYVDVAPQREREIRYVDHYDQGPGSGRNQPEPMDYRRYQPRPYSRHGSGEPRR